MEGKRYPYEGGDVDPVHSLGMDVVATRDIGPDEEIFIDYGPEWVQAWEHHVQGFDLTQDWPTRAAAFNANMKEGDYYLTTAEQKEDKEKAYPSNIMTVCYILADELDGEDDTQHYIDGKTVLRFNAKADPKEVRSGHNLCSCEVMERTPIEEDSLKYEYTVILPKKNEVVKYVPQEYVQFIDKPYTSDLHYDGAFRHQVGIPNDIFPKAWRDLKN